MTSNTINHASSLSIFLWNANGLKQHSNELFYLLHHKNIDIALITETHLSTTSNISFNGYSIIRADHPDRTSHGGAAIIIKSSLFYNEMPSTNESYLQAANIKIKINNFNITISSAYFPPNQPISEPKIHSFFHSLGNFLIIGGDFNAKHSQWGSRYTNTRGRLFHTSILKHKLSFISPDEPTYWPSHANRSPDILDFLLHGYQIV